MCSQGGVAGPRLGGGTGRQEWRERRESRACALLDSQPTERAQLPSRPASAKSSCWQGRGAGLRPGGPCVSGWGAGARGWECWTQGIHPSPLRTKPARPSLVPKAPSPDPQPLQGSAGPVSSGLLSAVFGPCTAWAKPQKAKEPHFLRTWAFLLLPLLKIPLNWHLLLPGRFQHVGRRGAWKLLDGIWIHGA